MDESVTNEGRITALMGQYATQMKPWVRFISVLMFIACGFMILAGLGVMLIGTLAGAVARETPGGLGLGLVGGGLLGGVYLLASALYFVPAFFLHRTANAVKRMQAGDQTNGLEGVLKNQKSFWRFVGILTLIFIICMVLALVLGVGAAILTGLSAVRS